MTEEWTDEAVNAFLKHVGDFAREQLAKAGRFYPQAFLFTEKGIDIVVMTWNSNEEKAAARDSLKILCATVKPSALVFASEVWMTENPLNLTVEQARRANSYRELTGYDSIEHVPGRKEVISVLLHTLDDRRIMARAEIHRNSAGTPTIKPGDLIRTKHEQAGESKLEGQWFEVLR